MAGKKTEVQKPEPVWIHCRATANCTGNHAEVVFHKKNDWEGMSAGSTTRYKCLTCGKAFHVTI